MLQENKIETCITLLSERCAVFHLLMVLSCAALRTGLLTLRPASGGLDENEMRIWEGTKSIF